MKQPICVLKTFPHTEGNATLAEVVLKRNDFVYLSLPQDIQW